MGGFGSGRPRTRTSGTIEASRSLDIGKLNRMANPILAISVPSRLHSQLRAGSLRLSYRFRRVGREREAVEQTVPIEPLRRPKAIFPMPRGRQCTRVLSRGHAIVRLE